MGQQWKISKMSRIFSLKVEVKGIPFESWSNWYRLKQQITLSRFHEKKRMQKYNKTIESMLAGINVSGPTETHFSPSRYIRQGLK